MVRAFIMVAAATGRAEALADRLDDLDDVVAADVVAGDFDVIVEADAAEVYDIIRSVATRIRSFEDVEDTKTYVCLD
jgi:DNA-binding Lrp family transcriptional regulator